MNTAAIVPEKLHQEIKPVPDEILASLYEEFAEEDRELAEMGMADYANQLQQED